MRTLWCKNQKNPSDRISHAWAPLTYVLNKLARVESVIILSHFWLWKRRFVDEKVRYSSCAASSERIRYRICSCKARFFLPVFDGILYFSDSLHDDFMELWLQVSH
jgi:hypothetical protein